MIRMVEIQNVGPIEKLSIPLPASGVVVLRGRNGVGKSHALAAIDSLISGRGKPPCRDGAEKGLVEGFGARLTIGRSQRRTGEAEVITLEGRLDISQLVQPPLKDEEAADRQRIKALVQLSGQSADLEAFAHIIPQGMTVDELVPPQSVPMTRSSSLAN
jgi:predicted ATPase